MMQKASFHILRVGLAITFLWIGVLIFQNPEGWIGYLQPWALKLLPVPAMQALYATAVVDVLIGFFLLIDMFVWQAALLGAIHISTVLIVSGITDITVRDIAILTALIALTSDALPQNAIDKIKSLSK